MKYMETICPFQSTMSGVINTYCFSSSINGIGLRESLYIFWFSSLGISPEISVAFGAIWILCTTVVSALGGILAMQDLRLAELLKTQDTAEHAMPPASSTQENSNSFQTASTS